MDPHTPKDTLILADQITKSVTTPEGLICILQPVSLAIKPAETLSIMGPSGSGKSTLISLLAGLDTPTRGTVFYRNQNLGLLGEEGRARLRVRQIAFVFQSFLLIEALTALENVMLPLELAKEPAARERARLLLETVGLSHRLSHKPRQLSGGEQQRVALARAFALKPEILFADEPTGSLDRVSAHRVSDLLFALNQQHGTTLVLVTHDSHLAARCERQIMLDDPQDAAFGALP